MQDDDAIAQPPSSETNLAARAAASDPSRFVALCSRVTPRLAVWAALRTKGLTHFTADDLVQEVWYRCLQLFSRWDRERPFVPWLFGIARNVHLELLRAGRHREYRSLEPSDIAPQVVAETATSLGSRLARDEDLRHFASTLAELDLAEEDRRILLFYLEGLEDSEIADRMNISSDAAKKRRQRNVMPHIRDAARGVDLDL